MREPVRMFDQPSRHSSPSLGTTQMDSDTVVNGGSTLANDTVMTTNTNANQSGEEDVDPIWLSSRTARQIYGLCQVEKVSIRHHPSAPHTRKTDQPSSAAGGRQLTVLIVFF